MTSSSYCELILEGMEAGPLSFAVQSWEVPHEVEKRPRLSGARPLELRLARGKATALLRLRLEEEELLRLPPDRVQQAVSLLDRLRDEYGFARLVVEEAAAGEPDLWTPILTVTIEVDADPALRRLHDDLVAELEEVHIALARDVVSRTWQHRGREGDVLAISPEDDLRKLQDLLRRFERTMERIGEQPSRALRRQRSLRRWRPGDVLSSFALHRLAAGGGLSLDRSGEVTALSQALIDRPELTTDIEEHRHLRAAILRLAERSAALARHCRRAIDFLEEEERRWSGEAFEQKVRPRLEALERIGGEAERLQDGYRRFLDRLPFLAEASPPRTALGPTPIFLGRLAYREAYRALLEARRHCGGRFDGEGLRVRFRNLATLYEYWLFIRIVGLLSERLGAPEGDRAFSLIDEVYRPELTPGQTFRFRLPQGVLLKATYEPDFPPVGAPAEGRFRSAMSSAPLRPDVVLELEAPGRAPVMLLLDAKSGARFDRPRERLHEASRYLWQIHDPRTGHQPARQLFLVHRDIDASPACNLHGYLERRVDPEEARVLGAIPARPGMTEDLGLVLARFLETSARRAPVVIPASSPEVADSGKN